MNATKHNRNVFAYLKSLLGREDEELPRMCLPLLKELVSELAMLHLLPLFP